MRKFAVLCEQQGAFQIAANLYSNLREYVSAMKVLIRLGNSRKVVTFAQKCKKKELYILAANFLQTTNIVEDDSILKTCVDFYKKAQAFDQVVLFYKSLSQNCVEENHQYDKAKEFLQQGLEVLDTCEIPKKEQIKDIFLQRIKYIETYKDASGKTASDPKKAISLTVELLKVEGIDEIIKRDDLYVVLVQAYVTQQNWKKAHAVLEELKNNDVDITWYFERNHLKKIYEMAGFKYEETQKQEDDLEDIEIVDADIIDEIDSDEIDV